MISGFQDHLKIITHLSSPNTASPAQSSPSRQRSAPPAFVGTRPVVPRQGATGFPSGKFGSKVRRLFAWILGQLFCDG